MPPTSSASAASAPAEASTASARTFSRSRSAVRSRSTRGGDPLRQVLRAALQLLGERRHQQVLAGEVPERVQPDQRLDPAHPGADRGLGQHLDHADLAGPVDVGAPHSSRE